MTQPSALAPNVFDNTTTGTTNFQILNEHEKCENEEM